MAILSAIVVTEATAQTAYPPGTDSLVAALNGLTTASTAAIPLWRTNARLQFIRGFVSKTLIDSKGIGTFGLTSKTPVESKGTGASPTAVFSALEILCSSRGDFAVLVAEQNYLTAVATQIQNVATTKKIDSLSVALTTLFTNYAIEIKKSQADEDKARNQVRENCSTDLKSYSDSYYATQLKAEQAGLLDFTNPLSALISTILGLITPPLEAGVTLLDEQKRAEAIRTFLKKKDTIKNIRSATTLVNEKISVLMQQHRQQVIGQFVEQVALATSTAVDLSKLTECKDAFDIAEKVKFGVDGLPDQKFVLCHRRVWATFSDPIANMLKLADQYDQLADSPPDIAGKRLKAITQQLEEIANGKLDQADAKSVWNFAVQFVAFAQSVIAATSPDNQRKVKSQIDALVKTF